MKTIAIIEDDQPIGDLLEEALGQVGYATLRAYSCLLYTSRRSSYEFSALCSRTNQPGRTVL